MSVQQISVENIKKILQDRLSSTNGLWSKRDVDDLEQEKVLFFKYFFDFSTAIESCLRGIVFEYSKINIFGKTIKEFGRPDDETVAFLVKYDEFKSITNGNEIFVNASIDDFKTNFQTLVPMIKFKNKDVNFNDYSRVKDAYNKVRKTRNTLAHGIRAMGDNIDFSPNCLLDFIYIYYLLINYYEHVCKNNYIVACI